MHLFTLLIAAAFSSSFVAPNAPPTKFEISVKQVTWAQLNAVLPVMTFTLDQPAGTSPTWTLSTSATEGDGPNITIQAGQLSPDNDKKVYTFTHATGQPTLTTLITEVPSKIFVHYADATVTKLVESFDVIPDFTVDKAKIPLAVAIAEANTALTLTQTGTTSWTSATTLYVVVSSTPDATANTFHQFETTGTATAGEAEVTLTTTEWEDLAISADTTNLYVWVGTSTGPNGTHPAFVIDLVKPTKIDISLKQVTWAQLTTVLPTMTFTLDEPAGTTPTWALSPVDTAGQTGEVVITGAKVTPDNAKQVFTFTPAVGDPNMTPLINTVPSKVFLLYADAQLTELSSSFDVTADFTVDKAKIPITTVLSSTSTTIKLSESATTKTWKDSKQLYVTISSDLSTAGKRTNFPVINTWSTPGEASVTIDTTAWGKLAITDTTGKIYVWANHSANPENTNPAFVIDIVEAITVTAPITDATTELAGTITVSNALKNLIVDDELEIYVSYNEEADPAELTSIGVATLTNTAGDKTYELDDLALPAADPRLKKDDKVYVYASYILKSGDGEKTYFAFPGVITVTEDPTAVRFEVAPTTLSVSDIATHDKLTIKQILGAPWTTVKVQLTLESKVGDPYVSDPLTMDDDETDLLWNDAIKTYLTGAVKGKKITVKVDPQATPTWAGTGVNITLTAGRLCTIDPAERTVKEWKAGSTFTVTVDGDVQWHTTNSAIVISKNPTYSTALGTDIVKKGLPIGNDRKVTVTVAPGDLTTFGEITEPTPLYVFVSTSGTAKDEQTATDLAITKDPAELEFAVKPKTIELTATEITGLTITPKTVDATWQDPIDFIVTDTLITPDSNTAVTEPGSAAKGSGATAGVWTATAPLSLEDFTLEDGMTLYVYASKSAGGDLLEIADTITVGTAKVPSFTITPVETTWATALKTPAITLTPTDVTWPTSAKTNFTAKFSFGTTDPKTAVIAIAVSDAPHVYTIPKDSSLADLEIAESDLPATVKIDVRLEDGTYMNKPVDFTVKKAASGAMGVSPLLSLLAALVFLFVKLF